MLFHLPFPGFLFSCVLRRPCPLSLCTPRHHHHGCRHPTLLAAHSLSSGAALAGEGWIGWVGVGIKYSKPLVCICKHTATRIRIYGGAAQLEVGSITVSVSWPSALQCNPVLIIIIIIKGHSLRRACLQPATITQNSKPRPPTTNAKSKGKLQNKIKHPVLLPY